MIQPQRFHLIDRLYRLKYCLVARSRTAEAGFTMSEVLVAILITTTFVSVALQGMVVAMLLKAKALHMAEADRWVQTDIEHIRAKITLSQLPLGDNQSKCHPVSADRGFAALVSDNLVGVSSVNCPYFEYSQHA
jgi:Tfp pilus assembly protein PilV